VVAVAMSDYVEVCSHCQRSFRVMVSDDVGFYFHWVGDYFLIDVVLFFEGCRSVHVLHSEVYHI
jgi:hypothetical protein